MDSSQTMASKSTASGYSLPPSIRVYKRRSDPKKEIREAWKRANGHDRPYTVEQWEEQIFHFYDRCDCYDKIRKERRAKAEKKKEEERLMWSTWWNNIRKTWLEKQNQ